MLLVLFGLSHQPRRHGELAGLIGGISRKVLTQTLRRLQQYGLAERHTEASRRVEYSLTDLGRLCGAQFGHVPPAQQEGPAQRRLPSPLALVRDM